MDIDEIFEGIENRDREGKNKDSKDTRDKDINNTSINIKPSPISKEDLKYISTKGNRKYIDGLPIYTIEELGIGQGGDTEDCPFECDCCY